MRLRGNTFTYVSEFPQNDRASIIEAISPENREKNFFYQFYREMVLPYIEQNNFDAVAFSVHLPDQLVPTFLLASLIKERNPNQKVILGGNYITRVGRTLAKDDELNRRLLDFVDVIVTKEGEVPLKQILERIQAERTGVGG